MESSCQSAQQLEQNSLLDSNHKSTESLRNLKASPLLELEQKLDSQFRLPQKAKDCLKDLEGECSVISDSQFRLTQKAKDYLNDLKGECYVISVSGSPMIGKSSLLNFLISFFSKDASEEKIPYQKMNQIGNGRVPTTVGVDMYCLSRKGKNFIFLDIEGGDDPSKEKNGVWLFTNFLQTALGVSHVHIYNYNNFPQSAFLNYFQSITKVLKGNNLHPEFKTRYAFLKRNDNSVSSKEEVPQEIEEIKAEYTCQRLICDDIQYSLHLLPVPPRHIIKNNESCIASTRLLCKDCQSHLFISILLDFTNDINQHLSKMTPFKSGNHLSSILEQLLQINKKELPFFSDQGHIAQMRLNNLRKKQQKISGRLLKVEEQYQAQNGSNMAIQKFISAHPDIKNKFDQVQMSRLEIKISKMEFLLPKLSEFIKECLLEENAVILDKDEKKILWETYVSHFQTYSAEITNSLKEYQKMAELAWEILGNMKKQANGDLQELVLMKKETSGNLKEFVSQSFELFRRVASLVTEMAKSPVIRSVKDVGILLKTFSGGIFGTIFAAYLVYQTYQRLTEARKKNEISLNSENSNENYDMNQIEANLKMMEGLAPQAIADLEKSLKILKEVGSEKNHESEELIKNIEEAMKEKVDGKSLSSEMRARLKGGITEAEKNLQKFRECLCNSSISIKNSSEK